MPQGVIKKLVQDRGFGFISGDRGDVFFHHSTVDGGLFDELREGQTVEYDLEDGNVSSGRGKGPRASTVKSV